MLRQGALLVLTACLALVRVQADSCECAGFLKYGGQGDNVLLDTRKRIMPSVFNVESLSCDSPNADDVCKDFCYQEYVRLTNGGDLNSIAQGQNRKVGQILCDYLQRDVFGDTVVMYSKACNRDYKYTGLKTQQRLCCAEDIYFDCPLGLD